VNADRLIRTAAALAVVGVATIAAVISYGHAYELVRTHGESGATARALPLTVDGLIVTCSLVLLDAARRRQRAPVLAWVLLGCGILATLGANVAHGLAHGVVGAVIAGWPALVAVGSFEMLARLIRGGRTAEVPVARPADPLPDPVVATARDQFAEQLAGGALPSVRTIRRELRVGHPKATRIRAALAAETGT
jgi:hypothetical protein